MEYSIFSLLTRNRQIGGRQVDGAIASLDALSLICASEKIRKAQESGQFAVLFDSGIRTGSDMIKAIALGAQAILRQYFSHDKLFQLVFNVFSFRSWEALHLRFGLGRTCRRRGAGEDHSGGLRVDDGPLWVQEHRRYLGEQEDVTTRS